MNKKRILLLLLLLAILLSACIFLSQNQTAAGSDCGIAKSETTQDIDTAPKKPAPSTFQPHKGQRRKPGTGCISQINENLWEGRYSPRLPNGSRLARNVYAHSEEECEQKLSDLIVQMKAAIAAQR